MKRMKIVYENYDEETNTSTITLKNDYGTFTGSSRLSECDEKFKSSFQGFKFAETKAYMKYFKLRVTKALEKRNYFVELYNTLKNSGEDEKSSAMRKIRKQIYVCEREARAWDIRRRNLWNDEYKADIIRHRRIQQNEDRKNGIVSKEKKELFMLIAEKEKENKDKNV